MEKIMREHNGLEIFKYVLEVFSLVSHHCASVKGSECEFHRRNS